MGQSFTLHHKLECLSLINTLTFWAHLQDRQIIKGTRIHLFKWAKGLNLSQNRGQFSGGVTSSPFPLRQRLLRLHPPQLLNVDELLRLLVDVALARGHPDQKRQCYKTFFFLVADAKESSRIFSSEKFFFLVRPCQVFSSWVGLILYRNLPGANVIKHFLSVNYGFLL